MDRKLTRYLSNGGHCQSDQSLPNLNLHPLSCPIEKNTVKNILLDPIKLMARHKGTFTVRAQNKKL